MRNCIFVNVVCFKQKTAYEMLISDWSSDVCSSDLANPALAHEVFGSSSILVKCATIDEVIDTIARMEGQLTATLQMDDGDQADAAKQIGRASCRERVCTYV